MPTDATAPLSSPRLAILGATGMTGRRLVQAALEAGFEPRALVRDASRARLDGRVEIVPGDATRPECLRELVRGCGAVVSALGPTNQSKKAARERICTTATRHVIDAMRAEGLRRYVAVTSASLVLPTDRRNLVGLTTRFMGPLILGDILRDKRSEHRLLEESGLDWTLVRAPEIIDGPATGRIHVRVDTHTSLKVISGDVARVMIAQVASAEYLRRAIFVSADLERIHEAVTEDQAPSLDLVNSPPSSP